MKLILALALTCAALAVAQPKLLFVCEHGAAKSIMAAAEFEKMAKAKGLTVEIVARGTNPDADIAAGVSKGLLANGLTSPLPKPVKVSAQDLKGATKVVTFGPDLSALLPKGKKALDWSDTPAPSQGYSAARDDIRHKLKALLADLQKK